MVGVGFVVRCRYQWVLGMALLFGQILQQISSQLLQMLFVFMCALAYLILLSSSLLVVVEDVFPDVLPALVFSRNVINASFPELVPAAFLIPNSHCH